MKNIIIYTITIFSGVVNSFRGDCFGTYPPAPSLNKGRGSVDKRGVSTPL
jgi:hypothetical protein